MSRGDAASSTYQACVARYLGTPIGATTPLIVTARMLALDPVSLAMSAAPSDGALHRLRAFLEEIWRDHQVHEASACPDRLSKA